MINALEAPCQAPVSPWVPIMAGPLRLIYLQKSAEIPWNPMKSTKKGLKFKQLVLTAVKVLRWRLWQPCRPCPSRSCSGQALRVGKRWTDEWRINMTGSVSWRAHFLGIIWDLMVEGRLDMLPVVPGKPGRKFRKRDMTIGTGLLIEIVCGMRWSLQRRKEAVKWINESVNHWIREAMSQWFEDSMNQRITNDSPMNQWIIE